jgi:hypothetical protein
MATKVTHKVRKVYGSGVGGVDIRWEQKIRDKIQASQIVNRLIGHVHGEVELSASQVTAAIALMHKIIPNLIYAETYNVNKTFVAELPAVASRESWDAFAIEHQPEPKKDNLQ